MTRIGITGNIGSGKSTIAKAFAVLGIPVYYADIQAAMLMSTNAEIISGLRKIFGDDIYDEYELLDRKKLSELLFNNDHYRKQVNALVHPVVAQDFEEWFSYQNAPYVLKEAALLFESGSNMQLDKIICVVAPLELRIKRVLQRDERSEEQIRAIDSKQMSESEKSRLSDYIIYNDETAPVLPQILNIHKRILEIKLAQSSKSTMSDF
ncbi:MAG: dephospho-CoA kinase [Bacteroidia bacterium]